MNYQNVLRQGNVETDGVIFSPPPANFKPVFLSFSFFCFLLTHFVILFIKAYMTPSQHFVQQYNPPVIFFFPQYLK